MHGHTNVENAFARKDGKQIFAERQKKIETSVHWRTADFPTALGEHVRTNVRCLQLCVFDHCTCAQNKNHDFFFSYFGWIHSYALLCFTCRVMECKSNARKIHSLLLRGLQSTQWHSQLQAETLKRKRNDVERKKKKNKFSVTHLSIYVFFSIYNKKVKTIAVRFAKNKK